MNELATRPASEPISLTGKEITIPIEEWPAFAAANGITVDLVLPRGETLLIVGANMNRTHKIKAQTLAGILARLFERAQLQPNTATGHRLTGGLELYLQVSTPLSKPDQDHTRIHVGISRTGESPPSLTEWRTVLKNMPIPLASLAPSRKEDLNGPVPRHWLTGSWRLAEPEPEPQQLPLV